MSDNTKVIGAIVKVLTADGNWHIARFENPDVIKSVQRDSAMYYLLVSQHCHHLEKTMNEIKRYQMFTETRGDVEVVLAADFDRIAKLVLAVPEVSDEDIKRLQDSSMFPYATFSMAPELADALANLLRYRMETSK